MLTTLFYSLLSLDQTLALLAAQYGPWLYALLFAVIFAETGLVVLPFLPGDSLLFISGTASILGHHTLHQGDVAGQTREIVANLSAVLASANGKARTADYTPDELRLRVYLRHAEDQAVVQEILGRAMGARSSIEYVQADIRRADLLVEIEANASHAMGNC